MTHRKGIAAKVWVKLQQISWFVMEYPILCHFNDTRLLADIRHSYFSKVDNAHKNNYHDKL